MRHGSKTKKLSREKDVRNALIKSLALSLILKGKIKTTITKAKVIKPVVERLVTYGKKGDVAGRRLIAAKVGPDGAKIMMTKIAPKYKDRNGGYTRIIKLETRLSDAAEMAQIEFV